MEKISFTPDVVLSVLKGLKSSCSSGPDGIPNIILKRCAHGLVAPLCHIFDMSLKMRRLPTNWKIACVSPIHKKGPTSWPSNYRPISLTSTCCRVMEKVITKNILTYLSTHNLISHHQHGFLRHKSTCTNLLECVYDWSSSLENCERTDIIYFDFQKAFDSVSHTKLMTKLKGYGISGDLLAWIFDFLSARTQFVRVNGHHSGPREVTSGVPQGSVLGPILFLIYINDITDNPAFEQVSVKLFADDIKIYKTFQPGNLAMQDAVDELVSWSGIWQLNLALTKCFVCSIYGLASKELDVPNYHIDSHQLEIVGHARDLGVVIENDLKFKKHINSIVDAASVRLRLINLCFTTKDPDLLTRAFSVYVRPLLEYCSSVWNPHHRHLIDRLERVQRRFTRTIPSVSRLPYLTRLNILGLKSLEHRRLIADLCLCYKILNGLIDSTLVTSFESSGYQATRGHCYKLRSGLHKIDATKFFFSNRIIKSWNALPHDVVNSTSYSRFRCLINETVLSKFLTPNEYNG